MVLTFDLLVLGARIHPIGGPGPDLPTGPTGSDGGKQMLILHLKPDYNIEYKREKDDILFMFL